MSDPDSSQNPPDRTRSPVWAFFEKVKDSYSATARRSAATCKKCGEVVQDGKIESMWRHVLICKQTPQAVKLSAMALKAKDKKAEPSTATRASIKDGKRPLGTIDQHFGPLKIPAATKAEMDRLLLRWVVMAGVSFNAFDSGYWLDFIALVRPGYLPPGECDRCCRSSIGSGVPQCIPQLLTPVAILADRKTLATTLLDQEYSIVRTALENKLRESSNITITGDGWTNARKESVMGINAITPMPQRAVHLLGAEDLTVVKHDAAKLAGGLLHASHLRFRGTSNTSGVM